MLTNDPFAPETTDGSVAPGPAGEAIPHVERARTGHARMPGLGAYAASDHANRDYVPGRDFAEHRDFTVHPSQAGGARVDPAPAVHAAPAATPADRPGSADASPGRGATLVDVPAETGDAYLDRQAALRALRNLEATEARLARTAKRDLEETRGKLVQDLLPVLDNLDRTLRAAQGHHGDPAMLEGVRMVRQQLEGVLRGYGVERVEAVGQRFDPSLHEAIGLTPVGEPARHGVVIQQVEPGYRFAGRLLRPAKVNVGKLVPQPEPVYRPQWR